jgi:hypothetical protein
VKIKGVLQNFPSTLSGNNHTECPYKGHNPTSENIHTKGAHAWMLQKENSAEQREGFILKQMYFSVNNDNATAWKYINLRSSAV